MEGSRSMVTRVFQLRYLLLLKESQQRLKDDPEEARRDILACMNNSLVRGVGQPYAQQQEGPQRLYNVFSWWRSLFCGLQLTANWDIPKALQSPRRSQEVSSEEEEGHGELHTYGGMNDFKDRDSRAKMARSLAAEEKDN